MSASVPTAVSIPVAGPAGLSASGPAAFGAAAPTDALAGFDAILSGLFGAPAAVGAGAEPAAFATAFSAPQPTGAAVTGKIRTPDMPAIDIASAPPTIGAEAATPTAVGGPVVAADKVTNSKNAIEAAATDAKPDQAEIEPEAAASLATLNLPTPALTLPLPVAAPQAHPSNAADVAEAPVAVAKAASRSAAAPLGLAPAPTMPADLPEPAAAADAPPSRTPSQTADATAVTADKPVAQAEVPASTRLTALDPAVARALTANPTPLNPPPTQRTVQTTAPAVTVAAPVATPTAPQAAAQPTEMAQAAAAEPVVAAAAAPPEKPTKPARATARSETSTVAPADAKLEARGVRIHGAPSEAAHVTPTVQAGKPSDSAVKDAVVAAESDPASAMETADAQPEARTTTPLAAGSLPNATHAASVRGAPETVANLAAQIVKKLEGRSTRFDVQLDPLGLGMVDVRIEIGAHGRLSAAMTADNPQAAAELRSRSNELSRALEQAGFDVTGGLSFDVAGDRGQSNGRAQDQQGEAGAAFRGRAFQAALDTAGQADLPAQRLNLRRTAASGVDIRI